MESQGGIHSTVNRSLGARLVGLLRGAPLLMVAVIFTLIGFRYLSDPAHAAAAAGIRFTSPGGIIVGQVGFAAFPLAFAVLALTCLISPARRLAGLYMVVTVVSVVIAVRIFGMLTTHSHETVGLFAPEVVLLTLSIVAIRLESSRARSETTMAAPPLKAIVD